MNNYQIMLREDIKRLNAIGISNAKIGCRVGLTGQRVGQILKQIKEQNVDAIAMGVVGGVIQLDNPEVMGYHRRGIGVNGQGETKLNPRQEQLLDTLFANQHIADYTYQKNQELNRDSIRTIKKAVDSVHCEPMILAWYREHKRQKELAEKEKFIARYVATNNGKLALLALEHHMPEIATILHKYAVYELNGRKVKPAMSERKLKRLGKSQAQQLYFIKDIQKWQ